MSSFTTGNSGLTRSDLQELKASCVEGLSWSSLLHFAEDGLLLVDMIELFFAGDAVSIEQDWKVDCPGITDDDFVVGEVATVAGPLRPETVFAPCKLRELNIFITNPHLGSCGLE